MMVELWKKSMVNVGGVMVRAGIHIKRSRRGGGEDEKKNANKEKPVM